MILGPAIWIADLLGFRVSWFPVRYAFILMLGAFALANVVALGHVSLFSREPKRQRWHSVHRMFWPLAMFEAFEYLIRSGDRHEP